MANNFFGPASPYLNHPLLTAERTTAEVDLLIPLLGLTAPQTVLDIGCGFGRHSIELARRGLVPTGVDPSTTMIETARSAATAANLDISFIVESGERLGSVAGLTPPYHGAIAMFTTLGQVDLSADEVDFQHDNRGLLAAVAPLLAPGARVVLELPQREATAAALVTSDRFGTDDNYTEITRSFDPATALVTERFDVVADGRERRFDLAYRLFSANQVAELLDRAGLSEIRFASSLAQLAETDRQAGPANLDPDAVTMYAIASAAAQR